MVDFELLIITLRLVLLVAGLTAALALLHKVVARRREVVRASFVRDLREQFAHLQDPSTEDAALEAIARGFAGPWSLVTAEELSTLDVTSRLRVIQELESRGLIAQVLRETRHRLKWRRAHAVRVLGELRIPAAVPLVLRALEDRDPDVRNIAARALGGMNLQTSDEALVALLGRHDQAVSARIAAMCIELGTRATPLLLQTLRDGTPKARFWAARILGEVGDGTALPALAEALQDPEPDVRSASARALGSLAQPGTPPLLLMALGDPIWYVRAHAAEALGRIADPATAMPLADALADRSWWVRKNALDALVRLGEAARPALLRALNSEDRFARDCAIEALTNLGAQAHAGSRTGTAA